MSTETINEYIVHTYYIQENCGAKQKVERKKFSSIQSAKLYCSMLSKEVSFYEIQLVTITIIKKKNNIQKETHKNILSRVLLAESPWVIELRKSLSKI